MPKNTKGQEESDNVFGSVLAMGLSETAIASGQMRSERGLCAKMTPPHHKAKRNRKRENRENDCGREEQHFNLFPQRILRCRLLSRSWPRHTTTQCSLK